MSYTQIPETLLKKLQCSNCKCYLSSSPIGIEDRGSICNRCWTPSTIRNQPYEDVAALHLFPCRYRPHGCVQYIQFNNHRNHEDQCNSRTYNCPISFQAVCNWQGHSNQLFHHFSITHPQWCLVDPCYKMYFNQDYETYFLTKVNDLVILLQNKFCSLKKKVWFNATGVSGMQDNLLVWYQIKLRDTDSKRVIELEEKNLLPLKNMKIVSLTSVEVDSIGLLNAFKNPNSVNCAWTFNLNKNNMNTIVNNPLQKNSPTKCPNCDVCMVPPIYRCPINHLTCQDCKAHNRKCNSCNKIDVEFTRAIDLEDTALASQFICRWENCQKLFNCNQIRSHEQECHARIYKCPECKQSIGFLKQLYNHFKTKHVQISFEVIKESHLKFPIKCNSMYVFVHKELFRIICSIDAMYLWTIRITYFGFPCLESYFRYEIKECSNSTYYAFKLYNNHFKVSQSNYNSKVQSENFLMIKFCKQNGADYWIPLDYTPGKDCF